MNLDEALQKIRKFCAYQERCTSDVTRKLKTMHLTPDDIELIIKQLEKEDFLNDERFVELYIKNKVFEKKWGPLKINDALFQKEIPKMLIIKKIKEINEQTFLSQMETVINKWKRTNASDVENILKLKRHLLSKGFPFELIIKKLKE